ncbi:MAG TPA: hypothetical protein VF933_14690 [Streptosporangiaceae bacterium]
MEAALRILDGELRATTSGRADPGRAARLIDTGLRSFAAAVIART